MNGPRSDVRTSQTTTWHIEVGHRGGWHATSVDYDDRDEAVERLAVCRDAVPSQQFRLVRRERTTTETVEEA
ncbi:hypothetical protein PV350_04920 [Streptomyces sp. PA03-6a]|nr:hypothetical protein [Streptomyces sp. PA03-6a]